MQVTPPDVDASIIPSHSQSPARFPSEPQSRPGASSTHESELALITRPKFKFKEEEVFVLPPSTIAHYLAGAPDLLIKPPPITLQVKREFIRLAYGGSDMQLLQTISAERNPTARKQRRLVFPLFQMNPAMPVVPGETGIMFASRPELLSDGPWGLFRRHLDGRTAVWLYLGEYECRVVGKMSKEDFCAQKPTVSSLSRAWLYTSYSRILAGSTSMGIAPINAEGARVLLRDEGEDYDEESGRTSC